MSGNPFDTLGMYDSDLGFFKSLKKAVKKAGRQVEKRITKVRDKTLPKRVAKELSRAAQNPIVKGAALAIATAGAGAMVGVALGKAGAMQALTAKSLATGAAKGAVKAAAKQQIGKQIAKRYAPPKIKNVMMPQTAANISQANLTVAQSPEFIETVNDMRAAGATPQEIAAMWATSDTYKTLATNNAAQAVYPQILQNLNNAGITGEQADALATEEALKVGSEAASTVSNSASAGKIALIAIPLLFAAFGG